MEIITILTSFECKFVYYLIFFAATVCSTFFAVQSVITPPARKHQIILFVGAICFWTFYLLFGWRLITATSIIPAIATTTPRVHEILPITSPNITLEFQTPVDFRSIKAFVYPETELTVKPNGYLANLLPFGRSLTIVPKTTFPPGERIMIFFSNIKGPLTREYGGEYLFELASDDLPTIETIEPSEITTGVLPSTTFTLHLSTPQTIASEWSAQTKPDHEVTVEKKDEKTLTLKPVKPFEQNTKYTVSIFQTPLISRYQDGSVVARHTARLEKKLSFTTVKPPFIKNFEPIGLHVNPNNDIRIVFEEPIDTSSVEKLLTITPSVPLTYLWESNKQTLVLHHASLARDTTYVLTINKGMKTLRGGASQSDAIFQFHTAGPVAVASSSPVNNGSDISVDTPIHLVFNQEIDTTSIQNMFKITPHIAGKLSAKGTHLDFIPNKPFAYNTTYTIVLSPNIKGVYGLPSTKEQTISFTTQADQIALAVPYFRQQEAFTCNIAALRMLLAYRNISIDETAIKALTGSAGKRGSGNPHKGYLDDYGTYWEPIWKAVKDYRPSHLITSGKLSDVVSELKRGNPVMIWGQNGWSDPHDISWTTPDKIYIKAVNGMHSSVVRGFLGPDTNPTHVLLNDPWRGQYTIDVKEFMRRWGYFNVALVVE